ncbi:MAG: exo-alpha-sialidase [Anaerolineales bacterium]|nr:exo-alpha-sialidase [Anaerolineales bacterium]
MNPRFPRTIGLLILILTIATFFGPPAPQASAQSDEILWENQINISNSPDATSIDPFLLADPAGVAHLFWAEKVGDLSTNQPDTLLYSQLKDGVWSKPVDIFFAPLSDGAPVINFPHAVIDQAGKIHLIWLSEPNAPNYSLNYSSAYAEQAGIVQAWEPKRILADDLTGSLYSIHIAYDPPSTLHILYARGAQGSNPEDDRSVAYIRSTDLGKTWSEPRALLTVPVISWGASCTRLLFEAPHNLYASWVLWDETGIGRRIYFTRSLDNGLTWEEPRILTEKLEGEFERNWNSLALLGPNHIMALWEGGYRAYRHAQYSTDGGQTWSEPVDTFPFLIGDNGFVEYARDSNNVLHAFLAQRVREGTSASSDIEIEALWHSVWEGGDRWRDPILASLRGDSLHMTNPKVVIINGNRVVATWYQSRIFDVFVMTGVIRNAPESPSIPWTQPQSTQTLEPPPPTSEPPVLQTLKPLQETPPIPMKANPSVNPGNNILLSLIPTFLVVLLVAVIIGLRGRTP